MGDRDSVVTRLRDGQDRISVLPVGHCAKLGAPTHSAVRVLHLRILLVPTPVPARSHGRAVLQRDHPVLSPL